MNTQTHTLTMSRHFRKDLVKFFKNNKEFPSGLIEILHCLEFGQTIPQGYEDHPLQGDLKGCRECHIKDDLLLIYKKVSGIETHLIRLGTHSEVFEKF